MDADDTSGLFDGGSGLIAYYTSYHPDKPGGNASVRIAYSKDKGRSWQPHGGASPAVQNPGGPDAGWTFRDPKVIRDEANDFGQGAPRDGPPDPRSLPQATARAAALAPRFTVGDQAPPSRAGACCGKSAAEPTASPRSSRPCEVGKDHCLRSIVRTGCPVVRAMVSKSRS